MGLETIEGVSGKDWASEAALLKKQLDDFKASEVQTEDLVFQKKTSHLNTILEIRKQHARLVFTLEQDAQDQLEEQRERNELDILNKRKEAIMLAHKTDEDRESALKVLRQANATELAKLEDNLATAQYNKAVTLSHNSAKLKKQHAAEIFNKQLEYEQIQADAAENLAHKTALKKEQNQIDAFNRAQELRQLEADRSLDLANEIDKQKHDAAVKLHNTTLALDVAKANADAMRTATSQQKKIDNAIALFNKQQELLQLQADADDTLAANSALKAEQNKVTLFNKQQELRQLEADKDADLEQKSNERRVQVKIDLFNKEQELALAMKDKSDTIAETSKTKAIQAQLDLFNKDLELEQLREDAAADRTTRLALLDKQRAIEQFNLEQQLQDLKEHREENIVDAIKKANEQAQIDLEKLSQDVEARKRNWKDNQDQLVNDEAKKRQLTREDEALARALNYETTKADFINSLFDSVQQSKDEKAQAEIDEFKAFAKERLDAEYLILDAKLAKGDIDQAQYDAAVEALKEQYKLEGKEHEKFKKNKEKDKKNEKRKEGRKERAEGLKTAFALDPSGETTFRDRVNAAKGLVTGDDGKFSTGKALGALTAGLASLAKQLENKMDEVGKHKAPVDTRLYGSKAETSMGSYWERISKDFVGIAGASPVLLQADLVSSLEKLVSKGISQNVKLRAFLDTVTSKVASTFDVADATLLKLVRIQQEDTTAARMGMESALNAFLNNMYETTEYLSDLAASVRGNLYEAQALMDATSATEFEYQVQKWMGSFYSLGMSDSAVGSISTALGQLAAGDINALTNGGAGNLMVMAANSAGLSIGEILQKGLTADDTNKLLEAAVTYLEEIAGASDSKVIQQQLAGIFGMKASDLKAITNITSDNSTLQNIVDNSMTNTEMLKELESRVGSMWQRTSVGEMMTNVWENMQYSVAAGMANNPVTYLIYKLGGLLEQTVGGIDIPFLNVYGFGVDLNTTVAQIMQAGAMAGGLLSSIGGMVSSLANMGNGAGMLAAAGYTSGGFKNQRGDGKVGATAHTAGQNQSDSGMVSNGDGGDVKAAALATAADDIAQQSVKGKEENEDATRDDILAFLQLLKIDLMGGFNLVVKTISEASEKKTSYNTGGGFTSSTLGTGRPI